MLKLFSRQSRKALIIAALLLSSFNSVAQIHGEFGWSQSDHRYFYLTNTSGYYLNISWTAMNSRTGEIRSGVYNISPNETMNFGPETINWIWLKGEVMRVVVNGSYTYQWENEINDPAYSAVPTQGAHNKTLYDSDGNRIGSGIYYSTSGTFLYNGYTYDVVSSDSRHYNYQLKKNGSKKDAYFN